MAITRLNSLAIPAGTVETADLSYPLTNFSSTGIDDNATSTAITIDSSENVSMTGGVLAASFAVNNNSGNAPLQIHTVDSNSAYMQFTNATTGDTASNGLVVGFDGNEDAYVWQYENNALYFGTANTERMRINSGGDVQIGTAAVTGGRYFDIYNTGATATDFAITRFITQQVGSSSTTSADIIKRKNGQFGIINNETNAAAYIHFTVGASERMRIDSSGNVNIGGTTSSTSKLKLIGAGSAYTNYHMLLEGGLADDAKHGISLMATGDALGGVLGSNFELNNLTASQSNSNRSSGYIQFGNSTVAGVTSEITLGGMAKGSAVMTPRMTISTGGFVGVGSTNPRYNLAVKGNNATAVGIAVDNDSGNCDVDLAALGSSYNAHGASPNEAWLFCANNINLGSATGQTSAVKFLSGGSENARIDADGIKFNGDTAATNALDDYEEGTWSPTLPSGGSITVNSAVYTKVGRLVVASFYISISGIPNDNSDFKIGNLPYNNGISTYYAGGSLSYVANRNVSGWSDPLVIQNGSYLYFHFLDGTTGNAVKNANVVSSSVATLIAQVVYFTTT